MGKGETQVAGIHIKQKELSDFRTLLHSPLPLQVFLLLPDVSAFAEKLF